MSAAEDLLIQRIVRGFHQAIRKHAPVGSDLQLGVVTQVSPLLVVLDGSTSAAPASRLVDSYPTVTLGDRVAVHIKDRMLLVAGKWE